MNRLYDIIHNAEPNKGRTFAHWFETGHFILVRKTQVQLWHSPTHDTRKAEKIAYGPRNDRTGAIFTEHLKEN